MNNLPVICLANQKGGVGKTTTAAALIDGLRIKDFKVLGIDCDPQANLSRIQKDAIAPGTCTTLDFMKGAGVAITDDGQASIPAFSDLAEASQENDPHTGKPLEYTALDNAIHELGKETLFDLVVIDTHPDRDFCATSAILASSHIVIPVEAEYFAIDGIMQELEFISYLSEISGKSWENRIAIVITKYISNTIIHHDLGDGIEEVFTPKGIKVFKQRISRRIQIPTAQTNNASIYSEKVLRGAAAQYMWLCDEVIKWVHDNPAEE